MLADNSHLPSGMATPLPALFADLYILLDKLSLQVRRAAGLLKDYGPLGDWLNGDSCLILILIKRREVPEGVLHGENWSMSDDAYF